MQRALRNEKRQVKMTWTNDDTNYKDSIPFVDDLRYFLTKEHFIAEEDLNESGRVNSEYQDTWTELETLYNQKLEMLDQALSSLGLEA